MLDKVLATISILMMTGFMMLVVVFVREPDLTIVVCGVIAMAIYDFWRSNTGRSRDSRPK